MPPPIAFDATMRTYTADGRLHIARSHISKAAVNPYKGNEIPGWDKLGLDPLKTYYMLRAPEELAKAVQTFRMLPILNKHIFITDFQGMSEQEKKKYIVGATGSNVEFLDPYLDSDVTIWEAAAIAGIESNRVREFSCSYRYVPLMTTGDYLGVHYDGIITQIEANHLAVVESGRAGNDVLAADQLPESIKMKRSKLGNALIVAVSTAFPAVKAAMDAKPDGDLEKALGNVRRATFGKTERQAAANIIVAMDSAIESKQVIAVMDALADVDDPKVTKKDNDEPEPAKDADEHPRGCMCDDCKDARDSDPDYEDEEDKDKRKAARDKAAKDRAAKDAKGGKDSMTKEESKAAMDALETKLRDEFQAMEVAKRDVRPVVGEIVIAMDSAESVYAFALDHLKVEHKDASGLSAKRTLFRAVQARPVSTPTHVAMDHAGAIKRFPNAARFRTV